MSEATQHDERGGALRTHAQSENAEGKAAATAATQCNPSTSSDTSNTEHDFRFPRRPADEKDSAKTTATSPLSIAQTEVEGVKSRLETFTENSIANKELLREPFLSSWKDDAAGQGYDSPEEMQRKDPLGTQMWRLYIKTKQQLPNQERMENLTWRLMAMKLRQRKQEEAARYVHTSLYSRSRF